MSVSLPESGARPTRRLTVPVSIAVSTAWIFLRLDAFGSERARSTSRASVQFSLRSDGVRAGLGVSLLRRGFCPLAAGGFGLRQEFFELD